MDLQNQLEPITVTLDPSVDSGIYEFTVYELMVSDCEGTWGRGYFRTKLGAYKEMRRLIQAEYEERLARTAGGLWKGDKKDRKNRWYESYSSYKIVPTTIKINP